MLENSSCANVSGAVTAPRHDGFGIFLSKCQELVVATKVVFDTDRPSGCILSSTWVLRWREFSFFPSSGKLLEECRDNKANCLVFMYSAMFLYTREANGSVGVDIVGNITGTVPIAQYHHTLANHADLQQISLTFIHRNSFS